MIDEYWLRPPERRDKPLTECAFCNDPIYSYDEVREIEKGCVFVHEDCFSDWCKNEYRLIEIEKEDVY